VGSEEKGMRRKTLAFVFSPHSPLLTPHLFQAASVARSHIAVRTSPNCGTLFIS
jgi:hypothetical protein